MAARHIALVCEEVLPAVRYGGTSRVVWSLALALRRAGHRITLVVPQGSRGDVFPVVLFDRSRALDEIVPDDVDLIHAHIPLRSEPHRPFLCTIHGNAKPGETFPRNTNFLSANHAQRHGASIFVYNGLDFTSWMEPDLRGDASRLAFLARTSRREKNLAGARRVARIAGLPLDVMGGRGIGVPGRVRFHGLVDDRRKQDILRQAAGLLFPVRWHEPFGLALIEAMYYGLPVFGTPYGSLPELVPASCGTLSADARVLAEAVRKRNGFDRAEIRRWAVEQFNADRMAADYLELYERILAGEQLHPDAPQGQPQPQKYLPFH
ncbi:MAG: glycosyltransferase [Candidatus Dadabacteria bacterium]|nr:MAG: glycosyltransferase [Candidatus Dadabacteria bacterium]